MRITGCQQASCGRASLAASRQVRGVGVRHAAKPVVAATTKRRRVFIGFRHTPLAGRCKAWVQVLPRPWRRETETAEGGREGEGREGERARARATDSQTRTDIGTGTAKSFLEEAFLKEATRTDIGTGTAKSFLQEAFLKEAFLKEAFLQVALLQEAFLQEALLQEAFLKQAFLQEAFLQEAFLQEATGHLSQGDPHVGLDETPRPSRQNHRHAQRPLKPSRSTSPRGSATLRLASFPQKQKRLKPSRRTSPRGPRQCTGRRRSARRRR